MILIGRPVSAFLILGQIFAATAAFAENPLAPLKLDSPRDTMRTYLQAMADYKKGVETKNEELESRLEDAVRTLNLAQVPGVLRKEKGKEAAVLLKEVIDRVIVINYARIPEAADPDKPLLRWRLKGTEIVISRVQDGDRSGEYLFSADTVERSRDFYEKVKHLPFLRGSGQGAGFKEPWYNSQIPSWLQGEFLGFKNWQIVGLFVLVLLGFMIRSLVSALLGVLSKIVKRTAGQWDDRLIELSRKPLGFLAACLFWYLSVHLLDFTGPTLLSLTVLVKVLFSIGLIRLFYALADIGADWLRFVARRTNNPVDDYVVEMFRKALRVFVVVFGALLVVQNLGFNVMSVFAGLGLGGLAFALAAKDTAANLFGSLMIFLDKPFRIGDWIIVGGEEGNVEEIGFRSTRIRTFYNSLITVPNSDIAVKAVDNMGRRRYRRIKTTLGLTYDTPPEKMEAFLEGLKNIIKANPHTRKDYYHVVFSGYGASSLDVLVYCFLEVPSWAAELVERQNIYLEILRLAHDLGVSFAFPTQTLHVENFPEKKSLSPEHSQTSAELRETAKGYGPSGAQAKPEGLGIFTPPYKEMDS